MARRPQPGRQEPSRQEPRLDRQLEKSSDLEDRLARMDGKARELKCEPIMQVWRAVLAATDNFSRTQNLMRGPDQSQIAKLGRDWAWQQARQHYQEKFDRPQAPGASDWVRSLQVVAQAFLPGDKQVPSILNIRNDGDWRRFEIWCTENYLSSRGLDQIVQQLGPIFGNYDQRQARALLRQLKEQPWEDLDQILMAGLKDQVYGRTEGGLLVPLGQALEGYRPETKERKAQEEFRIGQEAYNKEMEARGFRKIGDRWFGGGYGRSGDRDFEQAKSAARQAEDEAVRQYNEEQGPKYLEVDRGSAGHNVEPAVCVGIEQGERIGGVHALSLETVKGLVGEDKLEEVMVNPYYNPQQDRVVGRVDVYLVSPQQGPRVDSRERPLRVDLAIPILARALAESDRLADFCRENKYFLNHQVPEMIRHSRGQLKELKDFDLAKWYEAKLRSWGASTLAELRGHEEELKLSVMDIFPDQLEALGQMERDYPKRIEIRGRAYHLDYIYDQWTGKPIPILEVRRNDQEFLQIRPEDLPQNLEIEFKLMGPWQEEGRSSNLAVIQEMLQARAIKEEFEKTEYPNFEQELDLTPPAPWPEGNLVDPSLLRPFTKLPNGIDVLPKPAVTVKPRGKYAVRLYALASEAAKATDESKDRYDHKLEAYEKREATSPEDKAEYERLKQELEEIVSRPVTGPWGRGLGHEIGRALREARGSWEEEGDVFVALQDLRSGIRYYQEHIAGMDELFKELQDLYQQATAQAQELGRRLGEDFKYLESEVFRELPKKSSLEKDKIQLQQILERQGQALEERRKERSAREEREQRYEGMNQPERRQEAERLRRQADLIMSDIRRLINNRRLRPDLRSARRGYVSNQWPELVQRWERYIRVSEGYFQEILKREEVSVHDLEFLFQRVENWQGYQKDDFEKDYRLYQRDLVPLE